MRAYVALTDSEWFRFLSARPELDEVNFWQPSGSSQFRALQPGEPHLFKLHAPRNFIVGGGFFAHFSLLPHRMAWEYFGEKNGAATLQEMEQRIGKYRRVESSRLEDYTIGCVMLTSPFFLDEADWIPVPADWSPNIVRGKGYDLRESPGRELWEAVLLRLRARPVAADEAAEPEPVYGDPVLMHPRLGQGSFRSVVMDTYERHCAVTGERAWPALDAAHIRPVSEGGQHRIDNGLLLRSDIHRLYDAGYVTVVPDARFLVSRRLKEDFDNGEPYYPLDGQKIWLPPRAEERPDSETLEWHADTKFRR